VSILDRQKPREGSSYATYEHQLPEKKFELYKFIFRVGFFLTSLAVLFWLAIIIYDYSPVSVS